MAFAVNSQNIKQTMGIQVTFISEKSFKENSFYQNMTVPFIDLCVHF